MVSRTRPHTRLRFYDPPKWRHGGESLRIVVAESEAAPAVRGYALFRRQEKWTGPNPEGQVHVKELIARDPAAARALWGFLLDLDLMGSVATDSRALDDPLLNLLRNPRAGSPTLGDGIWVRLVDLPAALTTRRYTTDVSVVIEVGDRQLPDNAGRWRLTSRGAEVSCERTDDRPAFTADVRELGSAYLGSITLGELASAGQLQVHDHDATAAASAAWSWPVASYCGWVF
jgi:predicted acetyltransferase